MGAGVGEGPADDAGFGLLDLPAWGLFAAMVPSAFRAEVALVGRAVGPGGGVVLVAVDGLGVAAGGVAGRGAGAQEVRELAAGGVPILGLAMVALAPGDGLGSEPQLVEELVQAREPGGVGGLARARPAGWSGGDGASGVGGGGSQGCWPGAQAWAAAVPSGLMIVAHQRVLGCREAAWTRSRVSVGSSRPMPLAVAGAADQPRRVPIGTRRLMAAGSGALAPGRSGPRRAGSSGSAWRAFSASAASQPGRPPGPAKPGLAGPSGVAVSGPGSSGSPGQQG